MEVIAETSVMIFLETSVKTLHIADVSEDPR